MVVSITAMCDLVQRATLQAARCFFVARSYLAADKPLEAHGLFQRTLLRVQQAQAAWDDLEHPDATALQELDTLTEQAQASIWPATLHASCECVCCTGEAARLGWAGPGAESALGWVQAWRCVAHAESIAQRKQRELDAQQGVETLGIDPKPAGASIPQCHITHSSSASCSTNAVLSSLDLPSQQVRQVNAPSIAQR
jgi:hypothetical protein